MNSIINDKSQTIDRLQLLKASEQRRRDEMNRGVPSYKLPINERSRRCYRQYQYNPTPDKPYTSHYLLYFGCAVAILTIIQLQTFSSFVNSNEICKLAQKYPATTIFAVGHIVGTFIVQQYSNLHMVASWQNFNEGRVWCFIFTIFKHDGMYHLMGNLQALYVLSPQVESRLGTLFTVWFVWVSAVVASYAELKFNPNVRAVGSSGTLYALQGLLIASGGLQQEIVMQSVFLVLVQQLNFLDDNIGHVAHLAGLIFGMSVAYIL